ncbi:aldehyde dehydrogenase family protein [Actinoalloteichus hymeniacidonis]|uniref:NAD-dependent aldehyde dehydrogenase n=1 Tax=Actinoalloteichus hymeniacidonis TaxID=340345 RepID=A0AAC9HS81_9PSEU|nr:aldehyde dehydrogenase family protein [Actinoalloteichus hymeniacidonis]AOS64389.1 NAD-dependent aldehyde dehydrogenase [Actinoalloteichus hymeniacidonis]MBB5907543.1 aldehyde dehydrogenase (NAD+) [Actinoalloteichus hymeniacidonis]
MTSTAKVISSVIDGREAESTGAEYVSRNPSRLDDVVATVTLGGPTTLADAARSAKRAQREWAAVPAPVRGRVIASFGRLVEANKQTLAELVTREIGKPLPEALGEVQEIIDTADFFIGEGRRLYGQTVPSEMPDKQLFTFRVPVGVAAVITAGNFPVAVPSWYLVPALLCGNAVVWKPAEYASASARALAELAWRAGVPAGVLNLVYADGENTFAGLEQALTEGTVNKIGFTGSSAVGVKVGELAGRHLQSACLELGGKNPMVIAPDADLDLAVEGALFSGFGTAGQRCTSLGTVIVHEDVHDEFVRRLTAALENAVVGDPTSDVLYGPMLDQKFADNYDRMLGWIADHHTVLGSTATGRITDAAPRAGFVGDHSAGLFYHPVLLDGVRPDDKVFMEETFGPLVGITTYRTFDEALELADRPGYGLSASVYTSDASTAFRFRAGIGAGMVSVNNSTSGAEAHLPFGGNGRSGNGSRQSGIWVLDQFTRWQSLNWDFSGKLQKAQMDVATIEPDMDFRL